MPIRFYSLTVLGRPIWWLVVDNDITARGDDPVDNELCAINA